MSDTIGWALCGFAILVGAYSYAAYPLLLKMMPRRRPAAPGVDPDRRAPEDLPFVTIVLPVHNEERTVEATIARILELDYPEHRRQVLVMSDASTDATEEIVGRFADRGVELVRLPERKGKTHAENEARHHIRGDIVINTDASVKIDRNALKPLVAAFDDTSVGIASGRDVSVGNDLASVRAGESGYVGYEMWVRHLETRCGGIVGASGCFYASRRSLHREIVPEALSRDFAAPLIAREQGYTSVSVNAAVCYVPRTPSLRREYKRKVRTMTRGLETLYYKRHLMNPIRHGMFAWKLISHKLIRWLVPLGYVSMHAGLGMLAFQSRMVLAVLGGVVALELVVVTLALGLPDDRKPSIVSAPAYVIMGMVAGVVAWVKALQGDLNPVWEPTRRDVPGD